jgi:hypothetical protein
MTSPYQPFVPAVSALRAMYTSVVQVTRLTPSLDGSGGMNLAWNPISAVPDPVLGQPALLACRLDIGFVRPGKDQLAPLVAGRPPDRVGVCYYDIASDSSGVPIVRAGDQLVCVQGPVFGTWQVRNVPDVAQNYPGGHHIEVQVIEVSQSLISGTTPMPFPGSGG